MSNSSDFRSLIVHLLDTKMNSVCQSVVNYLSIHLNQVSVKTSFTSSKGRNKQMSLKKHGFISIAVALGVVATTAVGANAETITGGGASFQGTFQAACSAAYSAHTVNYVASSSGTGRNQFAVGNFDFAGSDAGYSSSEYSGREGGYNFAPITAAPIAIAYNLAGVKTLKLDDPTLGGIFAGTITKWNAAEITKLNKGVKLPATNIVVVYRSSNSGTTENFAGYLVNRKVSPWKVNGTFTKANGTGAPAGSLGFVSNAQLTTAIKSTKNSIGYADLGDLKAQGVKTYASMKNPVGQYVQPTVATATKFIAKQNNVQDSGLVGLDWSAKIKGAYNIAAITYIIGPNGQTDAKAKAVEEYANYLMNTCGPKQAGKLGYIPLGGKVLANAKVQIAKFSN
jgi:phosphate transport system substrate-binding protein